MTVTHWLIGVCHRLLAAFDSLVDIAFVKQARQVSEVNQYLREHNQLVAPATRVITYWSENGEFWRWRYRPETYQDVYRHVATLADDRTMEFSWADVGRVHSLMQAMEQSMREDAA